MKTRKKLQTAIALFFASFLLAFGIAACTGGEKTASVKSMAAISAVDIAPPTLTGKTLEQILATNKVRVAVPDDFPPFGAVNPQMQLQGYDIDVAREVATALGVELELIPVVGNYRIPFLQTNRVDMVISSLGKNKERALVVDFSLPYAPFFSGVYGKSDVKVASMQQLKGHTIGVAQGSLEDLEISKLPVGTVQIKRFASNSLTASALVSAQVELIATGNVVAAKLMRDNPDKQIENKFIMKNSPCYIGVRRGDTKLLERINAIITEMKQSGKLNALSLQWFGEALPKVLG